MKWLRLLGLATVSLLCLNGTCPPRVYTPPTCLWNGETPAPLAKGKQSIGGNGGAHIDIGGPFSGTKVIAVSGNLTYRYGLTGNTELGADVGLLNIDPAGYDPDVQPFAGMLHLTTKYSPSFLHRFASVQLGAGAGASEAAEFFSFNGNVILGWETTYFTPFVNCGPFVNIPVKVKVINFGVAAGENGDYYADRPEITYGMTAGVGGKVRLLSPDNGTVIPALKVLASLIILDTRYHDSVILYSFGGGMDVTF